MKAATAAIVKHGEARCSLGTVKCLTSGANLQSAPLSGTRVVANDEILDGL